MPETVKEVTFSDFRTSIQLQNFKKLKGDCLEFFEKISKKKQKINSLMGPKNLKKGTLWDFLTFVLFQNVKQIEGKTH